MIDVVKVLHLRASPFIGGPERQILRYASFDFGESVQQIVGSFVDEKEGHDLLREATSQQLHTAEFSGRSWAAFREVRSFLKREEISLICTHGYKADILGLVAGQMEGIPVASFLRGWTAQDWKVRAYERFDRMLLPLAAAIVGLSESQCIELKKSFFLSKKTRLVTNAIEVRKLSSEYVKDARSQLRRKYDLPDEATIVVSAGRLSPEKGTVYFMEAAKRIGALYADARFIVFGDGPLMPQLRRKAEGSGTMIFAGHVPDFAALLPGIDILVNASLMEQMPNVVLEAMSCGVPVVATKVGGVAEMAGPDRAILLVPPAEPNAIFEAVEAILKSPALARMLATEAQQRLHKCFSTARQKSELHSLYKQLVPRVATSHPAPLEYDETQLPFITIAMPVRNEALHIARTLNAITEQDYPRNKFEVVIADGRSEDQTLSIVETLARSAPVPVRVFDNPMRLSSAGRNIGIEKGKGSIIVFIDGHSLIESKQLLRDISEIMRTTGADCLCRPQPLDDPENSQFQEMVAKCRASTLGHGLDSSIFDTLQEGFINPTSSGAIYRRTLFDKIGRYDESFDACEDVELNHRVWRSGMSSYISPRLAVRYAPRTTLSGLFKQMSRYGRGRYRLIAKHPKAISLGQLVPPGFILLLLFSALLAPGFLWARHAISALVIAYVTTVLFSSIALSIRHGVRFLWNAPLIYGIIHFGLGLGFLEEMLGR